ncbi:MAG: pseudouridine synthase [Proteobacteria bacterium]|nr:pseudouridine synthase [Pseudomonadota bacterium]
MPQIRLQKYIADLGMASRREAERWIEEGRVAVNGVKVTLLGTKIDPENDRVVVNGKSVVHAAPPKVYWLLHKPDMVLTGRSDEGNDKTTIYDLPKIAKTKFLVSPVGRLDYRTEGLLILTNDGELNYRLCRPEYHIPREYQVLVSEPLTDEELSKMRQGLTLEDGPVKNIKVAFVHKTNLGQSKGAWYMVTVHEGRNRLVRRMFEHFDKKVVKLIRIGFGELRLTEKLMPGDYRQLTKDEIHQLKIATQLDKND